MTLFEEWQEARRAEVSGTAGGTRSTYIEWLSERQVILLRTLVHLRSAPEPEEVEDARPTDADSADPE